MISASDQSSSFNRTRIHWQLRYLLALWIHLPESCRCLYWDHASSLEFESVMLTPSLTPTKELAWLRSLFRSAYTFQLAMVCNQNTFAVVALRLRCSWMRIFWSSFVLEFCFAVVCSKSFVVIYIRSFAICFVSEYFGCVFVFFFEDLRAHESYFNYDTITITWYIHILYIRVENLCAFAKGSLPIPSCRSSFVFAQSRDSNISFHLLLVTTSLWQRSSWIQHFKPRQAGPELTETHSRATHM